MRSDGRERLVAVGADGARGGWAVACLYAERTRLTLARDISEIARLRADAEAPVAIDVPVGLTEAGGFRQCDVAARRMLAHRASTVFAPPARHLLCAAGDYAAMRALVARDRRTNPATVGLSAQSAGIARKVREVDEWVRTHPDSERWLFECHPELSFLVLNGGRPLERKRSPTGARERMHLVRRAFSDAEERIGVAVTSERRAGRLDWLDAYAALATAVAISRGEHASLGSERDAHGVPMRIVHPVMRAEGLEPARLIARGGC
jgi:predicted RNase H-like nuclease